MSVYREDRREPTIFNSRLIQIVVVTFLFLALYYRQYDLSLLMILILLVMGGTYTWSGMGPSHIRCQTDLETRRVFPGDAITLAATVENNKWLPVWLRIRWSVDGALIPVGDTGTIGRQQAFVLWQQRVRFKQDVIAVRRGVYTVGPSQLYTSDLLGFYEKAMAAGAATTIVVYPRLVQLRPIAVPRRDLFGIPGGRSPVKDPIYILGTRDYQPARPARHIHWKASARHRRLQEKLFEPSEQARVLLSIDVKTFEESNDKSYFEHTLEVLASLAVQLDRQGAAVGLAVNGTLKGGGTPMMPATRTPRQVPAILEVLAKLQCIPAGTAAQAIRQALGAQPGVSIVHGCYEENASVLDVVQCFQKRCIPVALLVCRSRPGPRPGKANTRTDRYCIDDIRMETTQLS